MRIKKKKLHRIMIELGQVALDVQVGKQKEERNNKKKKERRKKNLFSNKSGTPTTLHCHS